MAQPYVGEIRLFAGNFAPAGWEFCNGQLMPIADNVTLYQLLGTTYGGDGMETFALPDMRGRIPLHMGDAGGFSAQLGQAAGVEAVALTVSQMPSHRHTLVGTSDPSLVRSVAGGVFGRGASDVYASEFDPVTLAPPSVNSKGGSQPHENMQPYLCISYIISLFGIFPSPN
jgi:microcystin-dependent protein